MTTVKTIVCDSCEEVIDRGSKDAGDMHIDATTYGADFHRRCLGGMTALQLIVLLELDDITTPDNSRDADSGDQTKICYSQWAKNDAREIEVRA